MGRGIIGQSSMNYGALRWEDFCDK